jgi:hypothetical protein
MNRAESEERHRPLHQLVSMRHEEAVGVFVDAADVESKSHHDGLVAVEAAHFAHRLRGDREFLLEEVVGNSVSDFLGGPIASRPGDQHGGGHAAPPRTAAGQQRESFPRRRSTVAEFHERARVSVSRVTTG